jgi:LysR family glycine cleavage system transcriptional activator
MESSLGAPLFERRYCALALTEAGRVLQHTTIDCLERLREVTSLVRATSQLRQVSITGTPGFASLWLISRLAHFTANHPEVDVRISAKLELPDLERHRLDLAVRFCGFSDGIGSPLFEEAVVPVCAPELAANRTNPLKKPSDLASHTLLTLDLPRGRR